MVNAVTEQRSNYKLYNQFTKKIQILSSIIYPDVDTNNKKYKVILKNVLIVFVHTRKVNGVQNITEKYIFAYINEIKGHLQLVLLIESTLFNTLLKSALRNYLNNFKVLL